MESEPTLCSKGRCCTVDCVGVLEPPDLTGDLTKNPAPLSLRKDTVASAESNWSSDVMNGIFSCWYLCHQNEA